MCFRPLTGIILFYPLLLVQSRSFRPLTGIILPLCDVTTRRYCFRPLTGIIRKGGYSWSQKRCFRPLTGIIHYKNPVKIRVSIFYIPFFKLSCVGIFQQKITLSNTNTLCLGSLFHICILLPFFYKIKKLFVVQKQKNSCFCRCEPIYFPWLSTPFCVSSLAVTLVYHTKIRYKMNIFT